MIQDSYLQHRGDILIVDDVPENLQLLSEILVEKGHEVRQVINGKQALKAVAADPPDLILLDIKMPILDGYGVCQRLKANPDTAKIPIIFISALNDVFDKVKAFSLGGVDYINKPFDMYEVLVRVENQLKILRNAQELEEKNNQLAQINQDLKSFNYMVSHDLRRPLTKLLGFCDLLLGDVDTFDEETLETLEIIANSAKEMNHIISDLMRLAEIKEKQLTLERINLSEIATEIIQDLQGETPDRAIEIKIEPDVIILGDRPLLKMAFENLFENAWKYTSKVKNPQIKFYKIDSQTYCLEDNGVGFTAEHLEEIFLPFKRLHTQSEFEGTGVGLAIVRRIIEVHRGQIWAETRVNQGAKFCFTFGFDLPPTNT
ncbi:MULTISPECIES: response regulator [Cyanophyceae]|uniref:response regulator n=1 Tax=Cyanophyceae TaxID=3028117 RepID=UPI00016DCD88|nr:MULTISPECIES: response regulator [Cyanophyceae]ACB00804.1 histidine kinase response regulator hybrid protein [Picosynechococcus sp. PCC 7002]SMH47169.1 two-component system, unclassified family, sensor histidine kinase and response regulator [Picosynechococcus sp. OG1]SMQ80963.1 two-component system, unclassified family, sensor histidine kinase and response regulator [Synechococcus sp. 7002]